MKKIGMMALCLFSFNVFAHADAPRTVYGTDDRLDLYQVTDPVQLKLADSTVAVMNLSNLNRTATGYTFNTQPYGSAYGLCKSEPFYDQSAAAFCSGFLVAPDLMVTAGHCIQDAKDCANSKFVFGFAVKQAGVMPREVADTEVVGCKEIVSQTLTSNADYAIVRLDRSVTNHTPLVINRGADLQPGDAIGVIGHPAGLPTKVDYNSQVRTSDPTKAFYVTNLDTFGGNSGSAVFNATNGEVVGILVRGDVDFEYNSKLHCSLSNVNTTDGGRGEDVTKISQVVPFVPN